MLLQGRGRCGRLAAGTGSLMAASAADADSGPRRERTLESRGHRFRRETRRSRAETRGEATGGSSAEMDGV